MSSSKRKREEGASSSDAPPSPSSRGEPSTSTGKAVSDAPIEINAADLENLKDEVLANLYENVGPNPTK
jgi:hypothetical protein